MRSTSARRQEQKKAKTRAKESQDGNKRRSSVWQHAYCREQHQQPGCHIPNLNRYFPDTTFHPAPTGFAPRVSPAKRACGIRRAFVTSRTAYTTPVWSYTSRQPKIRRGFDLLFAIDSNRTPLLPSSAASAYQPVKSASVAALPSPPTVTECCACC